MYPWKENNSCTHGKRIIHVPMEGEYFMYPWKENNLCTHERRIIYVPMEGE